MIEEDYVSFEVAKLLEEKGFNRVVFKNSPHYAYNADGQFSGPSWDAEYPAPTLQMAMKWLREVHNLHCAVDYDYVLGWYCQITSLTETVEDRYKEMKYYHPDKDSGFSSPEEACEAAIKYCLENLI